MNQPPKQMKKSAKTLIPLRHRRALERSLKGSVKNLRDEIDGLVDEFFSGKISKEGLRDGVKRAKQRMVEAQKHEVTKVLVELAVNKLIGKTAATARV